MFRMIEYRYQPECSGRRHRTGGLAAGLSKQELTRPIFWFKTAGKGRKPEGARPTRNKLIRAIDQDLNHSSERWLYCGIWESTPGKWQWNLGMPATITARR
jgi:hypothetical protein